MAYTPTEFFYNLKSFDIQDLSDSAADIYNMRDTEIQNYLKNETAAIQTETTALNNSIVSLQSQINGMLSSARIRYGSAVVTCPAVGSFVRIIYANHGSTPFTTSYGMYAIQVMNNDHQSNPARVQVTSPNNNLTTEFSITHWGGGTVGSLMRIAFFVIGL